MLPSFRRHGDLLVAYLSPQRARVLLLAILLLAGIGLQLANPQVVSFFIDTAQKGGPDQALTWAAVRSAGQERRATDPTPTAATASADHVRAST